MEKLTEAEIQEKLALVPQCRIEKSYYDLRVVQIICIGKGDDDLVNEIRLNDTFIKVERYQEENINGLIKIIVDFKVTSEDYHDVTTLLYQGTFDVNVPERELYFTGRISEYVTSITNLYEKGQVGDFHLALIEVKEGAV